MSDNDNRECNSPERKRISVDPAEAFLPPPSQVRLGRAGLMLSTPLEQTRLRTSPVLGRTNRRTRDEASAWRAASDQLSHNVSAAAQRPQTQSDSSSSSSLLGGTDVFRSSIGHDSTASSVLLGGGGVTNDLYRGPMGSFTEDSPPRGTERRQQQQHPNQNQNQPLYYPLPPHHHPGYYHPYFHAPPSLNQGQPPTRTEMQHTQQSDSVGPQQQLQHQPSSSLGSTGDDGSFTPFPRPQQRLQPPQLVSEQRQLLRSGEEGEPITETNWNALLADLDDPLAAPTTTTTMGNDLLDVLEEASPIKAHNASVFRSPPNKSIQKPTSIMFQASQNISFGMMTSPSCAATGEFSPMGEPFFGELDEDHDTKSFAAGHLNLSSSDDDEEDNEPFDVLPSTSFPGLIEYFEASEQNLADVKRSPVNPSSARRGQAQPGARQVTASRTKTTEDVSRKIPSDRSLTVGPSDPSMNAVGESSVVKPRNIWLDHPTTSGTVKTITMGDTKKSISSSFAGINSMMRGPPKAAESQSKDPLPKLPSGQRKQAPATTDAKQGHHQKPPQRLPKGRPPQHSPLLPQKRSPFSQESERPSLPQPIEQPHRRRQDRQNPFFSTGKHEQQFPPTTQGRPHHRMSKIPSFNSLSPANSTSLAPPFIGSHNATPTLPPGFAHLRDVSPQILHSYGHQRPGTPHMPPGYARLPGTSPHMPPAYAFPPGANTPQMMHGYYRQPSSAPPVMHRPDARQSPPGVSFAHAFSATKTPARMTQVMPHPTAQEMNAQMVQTPGLRVPQASTGKENPNVKSHSSVKRQPCNCKKSKCLKLYCECFSNREFCDGCNCVECLNTRDNVVLRDKAITEALSKNKAAFEARTPGASAMGCKCRKSECLKKYCECFQAGKVCQSKCKCIGCANHAGSQKLIDKRRKMKDVKGAEYAMKLAKDIWEQPPAITQRSPARLHQTSSRGPILSLPVGKGMVATSYSQSRPNSSGPPMLSAVFSPISGTLVTPSTQPFKTIKSLGSGSDLPAISRTDVPQLNVVKSTSDVATPQIIVGESTKLQTERNVDVKIEDTSVVASDSHPRADSNVEVKIEDRSVVASHPPSRTDPNAQVEIKDTSVVASHPPSRTDPNAQVKIKDTSIVASQTQSRGVRRLLIESDDFSLQKKRKTTDLRLGDVEDLVSVYFGSKNLPQSQTTLVRVFNFLSKTELYQASLVCKDWSNLATDDSLGKSSKTRNITLHEHDKT